MPVLSEVVAIFLSSIVILTAKGQVLDCATAPFCCKKPGTVPNMGKCLCILNSNSLFLARLQNCEKGLLASSCVSVRPSVRLPLHIEQFDYH